MPVALHFPASWMVSTVAAVAPPLYAINIGTPASFEQKASNWCLKPELCWRPYYGLSNAAVICLCHLIFQCISIHDILMTFFTVNPLRNRLNIPQSNNTGHPCRKARKSSPYWSTPWRALLSSHKKAGILFIHLALLSFKLLKTRCQMNKFYDHAVFNVLILSKTSFWWHRLTVEPGRSEEPWEKCDMELRSSWGQLLPVSTGRILCWDMCRIDNISRNKSCG